MSTTLTFKNLSISTAEWEIMRVVWADPNITSRQIINTLLTLSEWKEGTVKSMLNRLLQKGALAQDTSTTPYLYRAQLSMKEATFARIDEISHNTCTRDRADIVSHLIEDNQFSQKQIEALISQLTAQLATAPEVIPCECSVGQCHCHVNPT